MLWPLLQLVLLVRGKGSWRASKTNLAKLFYISKTSKTNLAKLSYISKTSKTNLAKPSYIGSIMISSYFLETHCLGNA